MRPAPAPALRESEIWTDAESRAARDLVPLGNWGCWEPGPARKVAPDFGHGQTFAAATLSPLPNQFLQVLVVVCKKDAVGVRGGEELSCCVQPGYLRIMMNFFVFGF